jgi:serine/threonine protein kinase
MKTLDKWEMQERNKVARVLTEEGILTAVDHPFLATLYCTIQTDTHLHFVMEYCEGGELYGLLNAQPKKRLKESHVRWALQPGGGNQVCRQAGHGGVGIHIQEEFAC